MKLSREKAYKILNIREGAGSEEILRRYDVLLKKFRATGSEAFQGSGEEVTIEKITLAYNLLMGIEEEAPEEEYKEPNPLFKKLNIDEKKVRNNIHYYKYHFLISLVALVVLVYTLYGCATRIEPDLKMAFIGAVYLDKAEDVEKRIMEMVPGLKGVSIDSALLSDSLDGQQAYAGAQKAMVLFAAGDIDLFIIDKAHFKQYAEQGAFVNLDEIADILNVEREKNKDYILKTEDSDGEHLYGIDVGQSSLIKDTNVMMGEAVAAIRVNAENYDNALSLVKLLVE
jgi:hypothetical protein